MPDMSFAELCHPVAGDAVRFCTKQSISNDLRLHGVDGFYRDGKFWSADMADHWAQSEVTLWQRRAVEVAIPHRVVDVEAARALAKTIADDWACMTPEARNLFARELSKLSESALGAHRQAVLRADFEAWHLRRYNDRDYISATDKGRAWLAVSELAGDVAPVEGLQS